MSKALEQIDAILDHIEQHNPQAARTVGAHIKHSIDLLATFPRSGRSSEIADIRELDATNDPELKLQGIIRGKKKTTAIVNGKMLSLGDRIEGAFLLKIEQESVTFEKGSARKELFLLR